MRPQKSSRFRHLPPGRAVDRRIPRPHGARAASILATATPRAAQLLAANFRRGFQAGNRVGTANARWGYAVLAPARLWLPWPGSTWRQPG